MRDGQKLIKASEVGEYVFCARAWRMRLDGHEPSNRAAMEAGTRWHRGHGRSVSRAGRLRKLAALCALLALVVLTLIFLSWWWG